MGARLRSGEGRMLGGAWRAPSRTPHTTQNGAPKQPPGRTVGGRVYLEGGGREGRRV